MKRIFKSIAVLGAVLELINDGPEQYNALLERDRASYAVKMKRLDIKLD